MTPLLHISNLDLFLIKKTKLISILKQIEFSVHHHETVAIVGESGSGKTLLAQSIMRLIPDACYQGKIHFNDQDLLAKSEKEMQKIRGKEIGMIFQDPLSSLNPTMRIGEQIAEGCSFSKERALEMLTLVEMPDPERCLLQYPHQLSGGMRQRVMIAIALAAKPKLLIADEPTTALDATIQLQLLELLKEIQKKMGMSIILITHDLGVVAHSCDRVIVMYAGEIVEEGDVQTIFQNPQHPYTKSLFMERMDLFRNEINLKK